jgi:hypothetical protein
MLTLQRQVGNQAVTRMVAGARRTAGPPVRRAIGWSDASTAGHGWNAGAQPHQVGSTLRIPLAGLAAGLRTDTATASRWKDPKDHKKGRESFTESTDNAALSGEGATGRAVVAMSEHLDPGAGITLVIHLHGFTENAARPYAGLRAYTGGPSKDPRRKGIDAADTAPVRDVALDQVEQQLQESGQTQTVMVLPQGGLHSQFGPDGSTNFDSAAYSTEIVARLTRELRWPAAPKIARITMSGHSGAGATLAAMARASVEQAGAHPGKDTHGKHHRGGSSVISGDLVLFDAINSGSDTEAFAAWAQMRLKADLAALPGLPDDAARAAYLRDAPKLLGFYSNDYVTGYKGLQARITKLLEDNQVSRMGPLEPLLRANLDVFQHIAVSHEDLMRGVSANATRGQGQGGILAALRQTHPAVRQAGSAAPAPGGPAAPARPTHPAPDHAQPRRDHHHRPRHPTAHPAHPDHPAPATHQAPAGPATHAAPATHPSKAGGGGSSGPRSKAEEVAIAVLAAKEKGAGFGKTAEQRAATKKAAEKNVADDILHGTERHFAEFFPGESRADWDKLDEAQRHERAIAAWFDGLDPQASFLGLRIRPSSAGEAWGVHSQLAQRLHAAEQVLIKSGETPAAAAKRLQIKSISGMRVPKVPTGKTSGASMHCFGLAVDIDHESNPFVGNNDKRTDKRPDGGPSIQIIERATLLLAGAAHDPMRPPVELTGKHRTDSADDRAARAERAIAQFRLLSQDSQQVKQYLSMTPDELARAVSEAATKLAGWQEAVTTAKHAHPPSWAGQVTDAGWWARMHEQDRRQARSGDFGYGADPANSGFMTLTEEVVSALVGAGLTWGGVYNGAKDLMHFDLRTATIGGRPVL